MIGLEAGGDKRMKTTARTCAAIADIAAIDEGKFSERGIYNLDNV